MAGRDHCRNWDWVAEDLSKDYHIIAPDLRGHGDSQWMIGGSYNQVDYIYDIAQLLHQTEMTPVTIISHSLGGSISLMYSGLYPETVKKLVAIEGLGPPPEFGETAHFSADRGPAWKMGRRVAGHCRPNT